MDLGELLGTLHSQAAPSMAEENNFDDELSDGSSQLTDEETVVDDDSDGGSDLVRLSQHTSFARSARESHQCKEAGLSSARRSRPVVASFLVSLHS